MSDSVFDDDVSDDFAPATVDYPRPHYSLPSNSDIVLGTETQGEA